jgi:hypothetical protein
VLNSKKNQNIAQMKHVSTDMFLKAASFNLFFFSHGSRFRLIRGYIVPGCLRLYGTGGMRKNGTGHHLISRCPVDISAHHLSGQDPLRGVIEPMMP